jgi:hypothetical protein
LQSLFATTPGSLVAALFILGFGKGKGDWEWFATVIKRDKGKVRRQYVASLPASRILAPNLYADFHRRVEGPVHARLQDQELTSMDRVQEAQMVDGGGRDEPTGVALSRQGAA